MAERPRKPEAQPTISFQYYQPKGKDLPPKPQTDMQTQFVQGLSQGMIYPPFGMMYPYTPIMPQIVKNVQITTDGPTSNHAQLFVIHEDAIPTNPVVPSYTSMGERLHLYQFIRSTIFNNTDGLDICLDGKHTNTLLKFIKFAEINPYNTYKLSPNPYKGLPEGFLIYKSCYPIRYNELSGGTNCAKDSSSINVRIYKLLEGSFLFNKLNPSLFSEFDEWRDVAFYEYIREMILKKKVCPNFPLLYGYFISEKTGIDFDKIELMKDNKQSKPKEEAYITLPDNGVICTSEFIMNGAKIVSASSANNTIVVQNNNKTIHINPNAYMGKTLVLLTESPLNNIFGWACKTYHSRGNIREMINRGTHTIKEWMNVLFQLMVGLSVMQIHKLLIKNFKLESNVFVKDLPIRGQITSHWKYQVDGMDFYIPNLGHLVLIDSNYKDITGDIEDCVMTFGHKNDKNSHKIDGKCLGSQCGIDDKELNNKIFEMFKTAFDVNYFDGEFINHGGCKPPTEILNLMSQITTDASNDKEKDIKKYIYKYMRIFLHNRIGTYLKETEIANIRRDDTREFNKGQIVVLEDGFGTFKFVMYIDTNNGNSIILSKSEPNATDIMETTVPAHSLFNYLKSEPIMQTFKPNESNMNEDDLLETYIIRE